uniref:40S ribosomal protein S3 n=1 Tax=Entamoeba invadens TaxID=33085 RepID=S0B6J6_ENTIV|nr:40S ribosomal protein S3-1, putative [Entamoeba invadens]
MFCLTKVKELSLDVLKTNISRKHKFVADGVFYAELNELLQRELCADGYSGVEIRKNANKFQIIIRATRASNIIGDKGRRIRELTSLMISRFGFEKNCLELFVEKVASRGLCPVSQAESIKYKIAEGVPVRRAVGSVMKLIMESGALGCEVVISGKLRGQRAQHMIFKEGYLIKSGNATRQFYASAIRCVLLRMGIIGIKVNIMLNTDPTGKTGPAARIPDVIEIKTPKDEVSWVKTSVVAANAKKE